MDDHELEVLLAAPPGTNWRQSPVDGAAPTGTCLGQAERGMAPAAGGPRERVSGNDECAAGSRSPTTQHPAPSSDPRANTEANVSLPAGQDARHAHKWERLFDCCSCGVAASGVRVRSRATGAVDQRRLPAALAGLSRWRWGFSAAAGKRAERRGESRCWASVARGRQTRMR